jgi:hypothetical protein
MHAIGDGLRSCEATLRLKRDAASRAVRIWLRTGYGQVHSRSSFSEHL